MGARQRGRPGAVVIVPRYLAPEMLAVSELPRDPCFPSILAACGKSSPWCLVECTEICSVWGRVGTLGCYLTASCNLHLYSSYPYWSERVAKAGLIMLPAVVWPNLTTHFARQGVIDRKGMWERAYIRTSAHLGVLCDRETPKRNFRTTGLTAKPGEGGQAFTSGRRPLWVGMEKKG